MRKFFLQIAVHVAVGGEAELRNAEAECSKALQEANAKAAADADELRKLDVRLASLTEKADIVQKYIQKNV